MPDPYKTPEDMQDVYDEDAQKNKEFDDAVAGGTLEDLRKGVDIKKKLKDQIKNGYIKPIQLDSSQGFEDLQLQFDSAGNKTIFGQPKTVEQRVDDYNGMGSGRIVIKGKTNTPEGIYFYPDNTEANKKTALDLYRAQTIFNAPTILAPLITAGKALGGKYFYMPPKPKQPPMQNVTPGGALVNLKDLRNSMVGAINRRLESVVTGAVTKNNPVAFGMQEFTPGSIPGMDGQEYAFESRTRKRKGETEAEYANRLYNEKFEKINLTDEARLEVESMLDSKTISQKERRNIKMGISNPDYSPRSYTETRIILAEEFLDGLEFLGLDDTQIEAHHIASLRHVTSLFIGLPRSQFRDMLKEIYNAGIPTGNDPRNLIAIQKKAHVNKKDNPNIYAVHTYLNEQLGLYGEKLVGDYGSKIKNLSIEERKPLIRRFANIVKGSYPVAEKAIRAVLDENVMDDSPEALVDATLDIDTSQLNFVKAIIDEYIELKVTQPNLAALIDSITSTDDNESAATALRNRGLTPSGPTQDQLFDLGKKSPRKKRPKKDPPVGSSWDIESE